MFVCGGDKEVDYLSSSMNKFVIMKYRHLYKQPPSPSNPLNTFCLSYE
jgi:hypothetical protein